MADKVYALEVDEGGAPTAPLSAHGGAAEWAAMAVGDHLGRAGIDRVLEEQGMEVTDRPTQALGMVVLAVEGMFALGSRLEAIEARLDKLDPPA